MNARVLAATLVSGFALAACGGGGGSTAPNVPAPPVATTAPAATATVPLTLTFPRHPNAHGRTPQFLSPNSQAMAIYDGTTLLFVANLALDSTPPFTVVYAKSGASTVTFGTCTFTSSEATCGLTITTTIGAHKFDIMTYPGSQGTQLTSAGRKVLDTGTPPVFQGIIADEGEISATLNPGTNPAATLTMLGVASKVIFAGLAENAYNSTTTYGFRIEDSTNSQIIQPGNSYDNGPVTVTAAPAGIVTITPSSFTTPPASTGDQNFDVMCINPAGGTVTISFGVKTAPNTAYASGLTYNTSNYTPAVIQTIPFTCDAASASLPITVNGERR